MRGRPVHELSRDYLLAAEQAERLPLEDEAKDRLAAYQRFVERNAHRLDPAPGALRQVALAEPADNPVRADVLAELDARRWNPQEMWLRRLHVPETDPNPALLRVINVGSVVTALAVFESGGRSLLLVGCDDGTAHAYDVRTGERISSLRGHTHPVTAVCAMGEDRVVTGSADHTARVWDAGTGQQRLLLQGHTGDVLAVCALGENRVVTGSRDETVRVWDARKGCQLLLFRVRFRQERWSWFRAKHTLSEGQVTTNAGYKVSIVDSGTPRQSPPRFERKKEVSAREIES